MISNFVEAKVWCNPRAHKCQVWKFSLRYVFHSVFAPNVFLEHIFIETLSSFAWNFLLLFLMLSPILVFLFILLNCLCLLNIATPRKFVRFIKCFELFHAAFWFPWCCRELYTLDLTLIYTYLFAMTLEVLVFVAWQMVCYVHVVWIYCSCQLSTPTCIYVGASNKSWCSSFWKKCLYNTYISNLQHDGNR